MENITNNASEKKGEKREYCFSVETAKEIQQSTEIQREFLIDGIITPGLNLLAAPRKKGKSWFALDVALCVAKGEDFWGRKTEQGKVLYFALEDTPERVKNRINRILDDEDAPSNLLVSCSTGCSGDKFYKDLNDFLDDNEDIKLVIVDVMQKIRSDKKTNQSEYSHDYKDVGELKKIADDHKISLIAITHTRKLKDSRDRLNEISGGVGVTSVADTILMITSNDNSSSKDNMLFVTGRDVLEEELAIHFDMDTCRWKYVGTTEELNIKKEEEEYASSPVVKTIKALLNKNDGSWVGTSKEILEYGLQITGEPIAKSESALARKINKLDGMFEKDSITHAKPNPNGGPSGRKHYFLTAEKAALIPKSTGKAPELLTIEPSDFKITLDDEELLEV